MADRVSARRPKGSLGGSELSWVTGAEKGLNDHRLKSVPLAVRNFKERGGTGLSLCVPFSAACLECDKLFQLRFRLPNAVLQPSALSGVFRLIA